MQPTSQAEEPLSLLLQRQESALDTLAEVSRRHMDFATQRSLSLCESQESVLMRQSERELLEQSLLLALQRQPLPAPITKPDQTDTHLVDEQRYNQQQTPDTEGIVSVQDLASLPLMQTASAANHQLEQTEAMPGADQASPPQMDGSMDEPGRSSAKIGGGSMRAAFATWESTPQHPHTWHQNPPSTNSLPGFAAISTDEKPAIRSRFAEDRRKEVQAIRKRGACMRCRMLKKPCSEGDPCERCLGVKVARLWNFGCLRTRLSDELNLFSTSYFHMEARRKLVAAQDLTWLSAKSRLQVKFLAESALALPLEVKQHLRSSAEHGIRTPRDTMVCMLDEGIDLSGRLARHCSHRSSLSTAIEYERNAFLRATVCQARAVLEAELARESLRTAKPRPNYIEPSILLQQILELWVESTILAQSNRSDGIWLQVSKDKPDQSTRIQDAPLSANDSLLVPVGPSYHLIKSQLLAAIECRLQRLSKSILNEFERRLLQRKQVSAFATFIAAVIFLNCIERMSAFYGSLDLDSHEWPLDVTPTTLRTQASNFANLLAMLLRMRALPPITTKTDGGTLVVLHGQCTSLQTTSNALPGWQSENVQKAAEWLDPMNLDVGWLIARRDGFSSEDIVAEESWMGDDMRLISMVLLGDNM